MKRNVRVCFIVLIMLLLLGVVAYGESGKLTDEFYIIKDTQRQIAPGITDRRVVVNTAEGDQQVILNFCHIDMTEDSVGMLAGYADYNPDKVEVDTVTNHAIAAEKATGRDVVFAMNLNFFEEQDKIPLDVLVMNGRTYYGEPGNLFLGLTTEDQLVMGSFGYSPYVLKEAVGGRYYLIRNGNPTCVRGDGKTEDGVNTARNAIGMMPDGTLLCFVTDGKNGVLSAGIDAYDIVEIMYELGCKDVMLTDGGGSSTYAVQAPGTKSLVVENHPTYGAQRRVAVSLLITSTAQENVKDPFKQCQKNGHTYTKNRDTIKCSVCGAAEDIAVFSGLVTDKATGKKMYYIDGRFQTGWTPVDREIYYFNRDGISEQVKIKEKQELECTRNGYTIYRCEKASAADGKEFKVLAALGAPGHDYGENGVCGRCGWKEVDFNDCQVKTQYEVYRYTGKEIKPKVVITANGKTLNLQYDYRIAGYEDNVDYGTGKVYVTTDFYNGTVLADNSSSLKRSEEPYVVTFQIKPLAVKNLKGQTLGTNSVKLTWEQPADAAGYQITKYNSNTGKFEVNKIIDNPTTVSWTFKKLVPGKVHQYRIRAIAYDSDGKAVKSNFKAVKVATKPMQVQRVKLSKAGAAAIKVKWNKRNCTGYQIRYSTNKTFKTYKQVKVVGEAKVNKNLTKLTKGKRYFVKIRAYTTVNGKMTFGNWSVRKSIKL